MATKYGKSNHQIMLNWGLCRGYCVIPKSETEKNQLANMACLGFKMTDEDVKRITDVCDKNHLLLDGSNFGGYSLFA